jgi:Flp pilus assembly protein TadD
MSTTLNLADRVVAIGRNLQAAGRDSDALRVLDRLAGWRDLPEEVAEETHACLANLRMRHGQFTQARRHLDALLVLRPDNPHYHELFAQACDHDQKSSAEAAYAHYRRSLELSPDRADCLGEFGLLALRLGKADEGLQALRRAVELTPDDPEVVAKLGAGLERAGRAEEARRVLWAALFRNSCNPRFRKLWHDFRFRQACAEQEAARQSNEATPQNDEPVLLPFLHLADLAQRPGNRKPVRPDRASTLSPPHSRGSARASDQRRA